MTVSVPRTHPAALSPRIKSLNYLNNILAKIEGMQAGCIEALMLNHKGELAECSGDNIFLVRAGRIFTPPVDAGILEGVTRNAVIEVARQAGIEVSEVALTKYDAYVADEIFLTGSAAEVIAVVKLDGRLIGDGKPGPMTHELTARFKKFAQMRSDTQVRLQHDNEAEGQAGVTLGIICTELRQECPEAGLLEMSVAGKRFLDAVFFHHDEGHAVGQRPILIVTVVVQLHAALKKQGGGRHNETLRIRLQTIDHTLKGAAARRIAEGIGKLCQNPCRGYDFVLAQFREFGRLLVGRILRVDDRQEIERIRKYCGHRLGVPWI